LGASICVRYSAEDARRLGLEAIVIEDACRSIDLAGAGELWGEGGERVRGRLGQGGER
jgi:nicotinamidase-related amidase